MGHWRRDWRVGFEENGRAGCVVYREPAGELRFYYEFGGGDVVASISIGTLAEWRERYAWAAERRREIVARVADEVVRQRAPTTHPEFDDAGGWLLLRTGGVREPPAANVPGTAAEPLAGGSEPRPVHPEAPLRTSLFRRITPARLALGAVAVFVVAGLAVDGLRIRTSASPWNPSARNGPVIATLMTRLEPYVPSLHRDPGKDRYRIGLLVHDVECGERRYLEIARDQTASTFHSLRFLGVEGDRIWLQGPEIAAYDVRARRLLATADLRNDPTLAPPEDRGRTDFPTGDDAILAMQLAGDAISGSRWIGVLSEQEAADPLLRSTAPREVYALRAGREPRHLHVGEVVHDATGVRLASLQRVATSDGRLHAAFLRARRGGDALRLAGAEPGFLLTWDSAPFPDGTLWAARVDANGRVLWEADTGIGTLQESLPDAAKPALIGTRPRVEGKVPEPILVVIDAASGSIVTHSLWDAG